MIRSQHRSSDDFVGRHIHVTQSGKLHADLAESLIDLLLHVAKFNPYLDLSCSSSLAFDGPSRTCHDLGSGRKRSNYYSRLCSKPSPATAKTWGKRKIRGDDKPGTLTFELVDKSSGSFNRNKSSEGSITATKSSPYFDQYDITMTNLAQPSPATNNLRLGSLNDKARSLWTEAWETLPENDQVHFDLSRQDLLTVLNDVNSISYLSTNA